LSFEQLLRIRLLEEKRVTISPVQPPRPHKSLYINHSLHPRAAEFRIPPSILSQLTLM
jgi:hypothetical protein